jgi:hypothetical protein
MIPFSNVNAAVVYGSSHKPLPLLLTDGHVVANENVLTVNRTIDTRLEISSTELVSVSSSGQLSMNSSFDSMIHQFVDYLGKSDQLTPHMAMVMNGCLSRYCKIPTHIPFASSDAKHSFQQVSAKVVHIILSRSVRID